MYAAQPRGITDSTATIVALIMSRSACSQEFDSRARLRETYESMMISRDNDFYVGRVRRKGHCHLMSIPKQWGQSSNERPGKNDLDMSQDLAQILTKMTKRANLVERLKLGIILIGRIEPQWTPPNTPAFHRCNL